MTTVKFVKMPGEIREFAVEETTTVADLLKMAGEEANNEMEIRADGDPIALTDTVSGYTLVSVTKRLKGARQFSWFESQW